MNQSRFDSTELDILHRTTFDYFLHETNPVNGLVSDCTRDDFPASIAATGLALASYPVAVERQYFSREEAIERTLATMRFFRESPQGKGDGVTGYKGFYYHFLDMTTGKRAWESELSTIDSAYLLAGMLTAAAYFEGETRDEQEIRTLADDLYRRVDWNWARNGEATVTHGWKPERGFLPYRWQGYSEALILYILGLGSPTYPLPEESYAGWSSTYEWRKIYEVELLYAGPFFIHQLSHVWIDFRGIQDEYMRGKSLDYFQNSRRATYMQRQYGIANPNQCQGYGENCWGISASDGPGPKKLRVEGKELKFFGYKARGVPDGPDDGTIAPGVTAASLPFAPEIVLPALHYFDSLKLRKEDPYGYKATFNQTFPGPTVHELGWVNPWHYGLNQGPIVLMIENYRTGLIWRLLRHTRPIVRGLLRAGFRGGWLNSHESGIQSDQTMSRGE